MTTYINLDRDGAIKLKEAYENAKAVGQEVFVFIYGGEEYSLVTNYAKYLIEYLEAELGTETESVDVRTVEGVL